jgi:hypothetical protein
MIAPSRRLVACVSLLIITILLLATLEPAQRA